MERQLLLWSSPSENMKTLRDLCREYHALKTTTTEIKNQCHALNVSFKPHRESFKRKKLAIIAVTRKLLLLIYTLWKTNSPYIHDYKPAHHVSEALSA